MEDFFIALAIIIAAFVPVVVLAGLLVVSIMALVQARGAAKRLELHAFHLRSMNDRIARLESAREDHPPPVTVGPEPPAEPEAQPPPEPGPAAETPTEPAAPPPSAPAAAPPADRERWQRIEQKVGKRWLVWAGMVVLFLAAGFFVKYAIDNRWLGPTGRIVLGIVAGIAIVAGGDVAIRRRMRALGQALMGGGMGILYVSLFAGYSLYQLFPQWAAFAMMIAITVAGMTLAVLHDAVAMSILALMGGLATPVMVSTGQDSRDALFSYLMVLDLGVLGVMFVRRWRALDILAFTGTMSLFIGWYASFYSYSALVPTMLWLGGFYLVFLLAPFAYHLVNRWPIHVDRFILALANATVAFILAYVMLAEHHPHALGFVALAMSAVYIGLGTLTRRRISTDARSLFGFVGMAVVFLTLAVPLHLELSGVTLAWAVEGPVLLALGYVFRYRPARVGGMVVVLCAIGRLLIYHMPLHEERFLLIANTRFWSALCVPVAAGAYAYLHHHFRDRASLADRVLKHAAGILAGFFAIIVVQEELRLWCDQEGLDYQAWIAVVLAWTAGSVGFLVAGLRLRALSARVAYLPLLFVATLIAYLSYLDSPPSEVLTILNFRFAAALAAALAGFAGWYLVSLPSSPAGRWERIAAKVLLGCSMLTLLVMLTIETYATLSDAVDDWQTSRWVSMMAVSIVWSLYAAALLAVGFWKRVRVLRFVALGLFFLTAFKVVLLDMASVSQIYRIVSFLALGVLMTGASYLYHRVEKAYIASKGGER